MRNFLAGLVMALSVACGTVTITTGAGGTTFTVSGLSFQPVALYFAWSGRATAGFAEQDMMFGHGIAVSTTSRRAYGSQSDHAVTSMAADKIRRNDAVIVTLTPAGAVDGLADLDAITSDGFRLIIDDAFSADLLVGWKAWGGADLTNAEIVDIAEPGATGNLDIATSFSLATGLDDKALIFVGGGTNTTNTSAVDSAYCLGVAAGDTIVNAVLAGSSRDSQPSANTTDYCRTGECLAIAWNGTGAQVHASVTAWDPGGANGFRLNFTEVDAAWAWQFSALVLKGGRYAVGDATTSTGTSNQTEGTAYQPKSLLVASACKAVNASDAASGSGDERSIGVAVSATERWCASAHDKDAGADSDIGVGFHTDRIYNNISTDAAMVVEGAMDLVSFDATPGFTFVMDDADPSAAFFFYLVSADAPGGGGGSTQPPRSMHQFRMRRAA